MTKRYIIRDSIIYRRFLWMEWKAGIVKDAAMTFKRPLRKKQKIFIDYKI